MEETERRMYQVERVRMKEKRSCGESENEEERIKWRASGEGESEKEKIKCGERE